MKVLVARRSVWASNERRRLGSGVWSMVAMSMAEVTMGDGWRERWWSQSAGTTNVLHTTKYRRASGRRVSKRLGLETWREIWLGRVCFGAGVSPNKGLRRSKWLDRAKAILEAGSGCVRSKQAKVVVNE
jgi:hypothetical protein